MWEKSEVGSLIFIGRNYSSFVMSFTGSLQHQCDCVCCNEPTIGDTQGLWYDGGGEDQTTAIFKMTNSLILQIHLKDTALPEMLYLVNESETLR